MSLSLVSNIDLSTICKVELNECNCISIKNSQM